MIETVIDDDDVNEEKKRIQDKIKQKESSEALIVNELLLEERVNGVSFGIK